MEKYLVAGSIPLILIFLVRSFWYKRKLKSVEKSLQEEKVKSDTLNWKNEIIEDMHDVKDDVRSNPKSARERMREHGWTKQGKNG